MNKFDLEERLIEFSVQIIEIVNLPCEINRRFSFAISLGKSVFLVLKSNKGDKKSRR
ncbi:MAG: hypothetical protein KAU83_00615 [Bacteroidales bacterium]|nr:hypothetical protein [Bacteroidales bacterium]